MIAQSSAFIWWQPFTNRPIDRSSYPILINKESKGKIIENLKNIHNIYREELFPPDEDNKNLAS